MEKHDIDIELPPLPEARIVSYQTDSTMRRMELRTYSDKDMKDFARAAIEADRQRRGEPVAYLHAGNLERLAQPHVVGCAASIQKEPADGFIPIFTAPQPAEPVTCPICSEDEAHTGTCGSNDPRALCKALDIEGFCLHEAHREHKHKTGEDCTCPKYIRHPSCVQHEVRKYLPSKNPWGVAPQPAEPSDSLPRHVAQTLATAIYETAHKMGIANGDHSALSVPQCLHLLDCMAQPAEPVKVPSDAESWLEEAIEEVVIAALEEGMCGRAMGDTPLTDSAKAGAMQRIRALLARYGKPAEPVKVPSTNDISAPQPAAPDLLAAAQEALRLLESVAPYHPQPAALRAAIAKATGSQT